MSAPPPSAAEPRAAAPAFPAVFTFAGVLAAGCALAFLTCFSTFSAYDDEGYLLLSVRTFLGGEPLYDRVFTQYGPTYYLAQAALHALAAVPLTHDATRWVTIGLWLSCAAGLGATLWAWTRSPWVGALVAAGALVRLSTFAAEPGHPQELVTLLLVAGVAVAPRALIESRRWALLGIVGGLLVTTKINVGAFFALGVAATLLLHAPARVGRTTRAWILGLAGLAVPLVLVRAHLHEAFGGGLALHLAASLVGFALVGVRFAEPHEWSWRGPVAAVSAGAITAGLVLASALARGTSVAALLDGLILRPGRLPGAFVLPLTPPLWASASAVLALAAAVLVSRARAPLPAAPLAWARLVFALLGGVLLVGAPRAVLLGAGPWSWLALDLAPAAGGGGRSLQRTLLAAASVWQGLQVYPVAGSQVAISTVLLAGLCGLAGYEALSTLPRAVRAREALGPRGGRVASAIIALASVAVFSLGVCDLPGAWARFEASVPLDLPGARLLRVAPRSAELYRTLARVVAARADTFVSLPGFNSLHFWSGVPPPTGLNATGSVVLLTESEQRRVVEAVEGRPRALVLVNEQSVRAWLRWSAEVRSPLLDLVARCEPQGGLGPWRFFAPRSQTTQPP